MIQCNLSINKTPIDKGSHVSVKSQFTYTANSKPRLSSIYIYGKIVEQLKGWGNFVLEKARYCVEDGNEAE